MHPPVVREGEKTVGKGLRPEREGLEAEEAGKGLRPEREGPEAEEAEEGRGARERGGSIWNPLEKALNGSA